MLKNERVDLDKGKSLLKKKLLQLMPKPGDYETGIPGFAIYRRNSAVQPQPVMYKPVVIIIAQGEKWLRLGDEEYTYGEGDCFIAGVDLPVASCMRDITPATPFVSLSLDLDKSLIAQIVAEVPPANGQGSTLFRGAMVQKVDADLLDAFLRLAELLEKPGQVAPLSPLIIREIHYRLLMGPFGSQLRSIYTFGSQCNQIAWTINWLRHNFAQPFQVDDLAKQVNMATSTFHKHFKEMTSLSPLQYQKRLRLTEARRLMIMGSLDASQACMAVGYESLTQFNREYKRLFGEPPLRDVTRMREEAALSPARSSKEIRLSL